MTSLTVYPLLLERQLVYRMWGGQRIADWLNFAKPRPDHIGETWEIFDTNLIRNGALQGQTLAQATRHFGKYLVGTRTYERYGADFPLLLKFIDANDKLSIQVHPDDTYARAHEAGTGFHGKTEAWYILETRGNTEIIHGLKQPMTRTDFAAAVEATTLEDYVRHVPIRTGDVVFTPPGTLHAINNGLLLFEIQQKSDLTYRVYDYGRRDPATGRLRTLHLDKALDVMRYTPLSHPKATPLALEPDESRMLLVACQHFAVELWHMQREHVLVPHLDTMEILTVIKGTANLTWAEGTIPLDIGDSVILPAALEQVSVSPVSEPCRMLRVYVPDLEFDILSPLWELGYEKDSVARVLFDV